VENNNWNWTAGFWTGEIWLAYEYVKEHMEEIKEAQIGEPTEVMNTLRKAAEIQMKSFQYRIVNKKQVDFHDMGFLYTPSCVAGYKLIGSEVGKGSAILAANQLVARFQPLGNFIQAWGPMGASDNYRLIVDCLLNLPLLFWATEETGDTHYREIAQAHLKTTISTIIRENASTYHTYFFDLETGAPLKGSAHQGYSTESTWARGQAWAVYGMALAYRYTKQPEYMELFRKVTAYFMQHLPEDRIPYWDLDFVEGDEPRDSSAASIVACGILEMCQYLEEKEANEYRKTAEQLVKAVYDTCAVKDDDHSYGRVLHSTAAKSSPYNTCDSFGIDECTLYGDYFYMEALTRLEKKWKPYW